MSENRDDNYHATWAHSCFYYKPDTSPPYSFVVDILVVPHLALCMFSGKCQNWGSKFGEMESRGINNPISESENHVINVV